MKKIILFGTGAYGLSFIEYFGRDNIQAICDNACLREGLKYDVRYIPFEKMLDEYNETILILSMNLSNAISVIEQLNAYGVKDYLVSTDYFIKKMNSMASCEFIKLLNIDSERYQMERDQYIEIWKKREKQFSILRSVVDARCLKPANGFIKLLQNQLSEFAIDVFAHISELKIRPFLVGGSLLGYVRNGGFIPWDDDLDFGLFREEYNKLIDYGKENMVFIEIGAAISIENHRQIELAMKEHPNKLIMLVSPNCLQIKKGHSEIDSNILDFFPYDYYSKDYKFEDHINLLNELKQYRYTEVGNSFFEKIIHERGLTTNDGEYIYFGIDNLDSFTCSNTCWISKEVIEPLKPCIFENIPCYVPDKPERLLEYFYKNYMDLPNEFSSHHIEETRTNIIKSSYKSCGVYVSDSTNIVDLIKIYSELRELAVYCVFIVDWFNKNLRRLLEEYQVEIVGDDTEFDVVLYDHLKNCKLKADRMIMLKSEDDYRIIIDEIISLVNRD